MTQCEEWLARIVDAAQDIASREFQQEAWFPGGRFVSSPDEVFQVLMEDYGFDRFFELYGHKFTEEQIRVAKEFRDMLEQYYDKMPKNPDPLQVLNDPDWDLVRQAAARFVLQFNVKRTENNAFGSADRGSRN